MFALMIELPPFDGGWVILRRAVFYLKQDVPTAGYFYFEVRLQVAGFCFDDSIYFGRAKNRSEIYPHRYRDTQKERCRVAKGKWEGTEEERERETRHEGEREKEIDIAIYQLNMIDINTFTLLIRMKRKTLKRVKRKRKRTG